MTPVAAALRLGVTPLAVDEAGVPHLLRGGLGAPRMPAADAAATARMQLARLAPVWGIRDAALPVLESLGEVSLPGGTLVRLRQVIDGVPVDRDAGGEVRVMVGSGGELVAASGALFAADAPRARVAAGTLDDAGAVALAVSDFYQARVPPAALSVRALAADGSRVLAAQTDGVVVSRSRARKAWVPIDGALVEAWVVEAYASRASSSAGDAFHTVLSGDGRVLARQNLVADAAASYRVFADADGDHKPFDGPIADVTPHPVGSPGTAPYPPYVLPSLVTVDGFNHPQASAAPDAWLAPGLTETVGNNVDAYTDLHPPDGLTFGDFRATATGDRTFDRTFDTSLSAIATPDQQMAGITQLFYEINWLHDFWYDAGFTEAMGNAQDRNFNRGGEDRDAMLAEAQDNANDGSRNNANMATPADGLPPRMQVFVWDGQADGTLLDGALDFTVIAHEFAHYLHHRLSACTTVLCGAQSEGWGDFDALLTMAQPGDDFDGAYAAGVYSTQSFAADPMYFGIRRAPYSTSLEVNPLTFKHMGVDNPLPAGTAAHPFNGRGNQAEVHNAGEVWASMLWQGFAALLEQPGADFAATRRRMQQYVVAGLLMSPVDATPTETRDAILTAAHATSPADHDVLAAAYAQRGFGTCAVSPPRTSISFGGIVESYEVQGRLATGAAAVEAVVSCDDDGVLDGGETVRIAIPIANTGAAALDDVTASLTAGAPGVHIAEATVALGTLAPYASAIASFDVTLDEGVSTRLAGDFHVELIAPSACIPAVEVPVSIRLNTDDLPASTATDTFDTGGSVWTPSGSEGRWSHNRRSALDGYWAGADPGSISDASLVSPPLTAGASPLTFSFAHRFSFEAAGATGFDGGVVEFTTDEGATWSDISTVADPGYNTTLAGSTDTTGNPLAGRRAYGRNNFTFPDPETVVLHLGTALAGKSFRIRFRIGSDSMNGALGWEIDNIAFTGIVGLPFPALVSDPDHCRAAPDPDQPGGNVDDPPNHDGGCRTTTGSGLWLAFGVLAVLLRRRG